MDGENDVPLDYGDGPTEVTDAVVHQAEAEVHAAQPAVHAAAAATKLVQQRKQIRKRQRNDDSDEDLAVGPNGGHVDVAAIRELREEQKLRSKSRGLDSVKLMAANAEADAAAATT